MKERYWENQNIQQVNRLMPRSYFHTYCDLDKALTYQKGLALNELSLNGLWDFKLYRSPLSIDDDVLKPEAYEWNKIRVPSNWQLEGFGKMHYTDSHYPFNIDPPYVPSENPTGVYTRRFDIPDRWLEGISILRFDGVDSGFHVYINQKFIGYSQGSRMPSEFDISDVIESENNIITVIVHKFCDGSYLEDQDMWWLSGIFRDVSLISKNQNYIHDVRVVGDLDSQYENGILNIDIDMICTKGNKECYTVEYELRDKLHRLISNKKQNIIIDSDNKNFSSQILITKPLKWTAETPNLYDLIIKLTHKNETLEIIPIEVGFRKIEIKDGLIHLNGRYIMLKGVNLHDFHPKLGRSVTKDIIKKDLIMIKQHNMNAIRACHYPHNSYLYQLCNQVGLYVIDEADIECNGFEFTEDMNMLTEDPTWQEAYVDRVERLVARDINNPSIIIWSLGNEAGYGINFQAAAKKCRELDSSRLLHYEEDRYAESTDMYSSMYTRIEDLDGIGNMDSDKPHIVCEYAHAMGNGPGGIEDYWDKFNKYDRIQGAFIWEWVDQGIESEDNTTGEIFYKYGGDYGDYPNNKNFVLDGVVTPDRKVSPGLLELKRVLQSVRIKLVDKTKGSIDIDNQYDYINLRDYRLYWSIDSMGIVLDSGNKTLNIKSRESECMDLNYMDYSSINGDVYLNIEIRSDRKTTWCEVGHIIAKEQFHIQNKLTVLSLSDSNIGFKESTERYNIWGSNFQIVFDKIRGCISSYSYGGEEFIKDTIRINLWRAPIDNDIKVIDDFKKWFINKMTERVMSLSINRFEDFIEIHVKTKLAPPTFMYGYICDYKYCIYGNGLIEVHIVGNKFGEGPNVLPKIGVTTEINPSLSNNRWYGNGPHENYIDRQKSSDVDIYEKSTKDMYTQYVYPQESGNRGNTKWFSTTDILGNGIFVSSKMGMNYSALYFNDQTLESSQHMNEIKRNNNIVLDIDYKHNGLGSASWGQEQLEKHTLRFEDFSFEFKFSGFNNNHINEEAMYRLFEGK